MKYKKENGLNHLGNESDNSEKSDSIYEDPGEEKPAKFLIKKLP